MKVTCLDTLDSAWAAAEAWQMLASKNPMHSPEWLLSWWRAFGESNQLMVLQCQDTDGQVVGIAPFYLEREFGSVAIRSLGSGEVCSDYIRILSQEGREQDVSIAVTEYLTSFCKKHSATQSACISIEGVEADAPWLDEFCRSTKSKGFQNWLQPITSSFRLKLPNSMDEYLRSLGDSAKRKGKKLVSKLRSGSVSWHSTDQRSTDQQSTTRFESTQTNTDQGSNILTRLSELQRLHQARRVMLDQPGCFSNANFENFLTEAVELLSKRGLARIDWCEVEGKTVATHLVLKGNDTLFMYQSGLDPAAMKLEPGHLLMIASIQNAIERGVHYYDTLRGDEKYKTYWGGAAVSLATLHCRPPHLFSQVAGFSQFRFWQLKQAAKRILASANLYPQGTARAAASTGS
ncbi:MAG: GNAT family N-acetyltransferase [Planctomycetota bacterium]|nr:GNAT family N-acetyltransferase [Planctomycetota bacterium]